MQVDMSGRRLSFVIFVFCFVNKTAAQDGESKSCFIFKQLCTKCIMRGLTPGGQSKPARRSERR